MYVLVAGVYSKDVSLNLFHSSCPWIWLYPWGPDDWQYNACFRGAERYSRYVEGVCHPPFSFLANMRISYTHAGQIYSANSPHWFREQYEKRRKPQYSNHNHGVSVAWTDFKLGLVNLYVTGAILTFQMKGFLGTEKLIFSLPGAFLQSSANLNHCL